MNRTQKCVHAKGMYLLLCLSMFAGSSKAQSCDPLTLDSITDPGIYSVGILTESNGLRNGPDYSGATLYYPTDATPPFASIAMVPGFISFQSSIQDWGPFLASHGIVAMTLGTNSLFDDPYDRRDALLDAIVTITEENTRSGSPSARKDFLYYADFLSALELVVARRLTGIYNLSAGESHHVSEVIRLVMEHTGRTVQLETRPAPVWDVHDSLLDNSRFVTATGWKPQVPLPEGIRRAAAGYAWH